MAIALNDSPAGRAAGMVEKRRTWSHCGGNVESRFSKDELFTVSTLDWATQSHGTSARDDDECTHNPWRSSHARQPVVESPAGLAYFENKIANMPRRWCERDYDLRHYTRFARGGHFAPMEGPEARVTAIRAFFRAL